MDIVLDDEKQRIYGEETITYYNNSPDELEYLWVQLDQNIRAADAKTKDVRAGGPSTYYNPKKFTEEFLGRPFDGGFKIEFVKDLDNRDLSALLSDKKPTDLRDGGYFLVDPLGNLVLYFPPDIDPSDMVDDIKRLLRLSRIG